MRFTVYVPKKYEESFIKFVKNQKYPSKRICSIINDDMNLNIPILRHTFISNPKELIRIKELLKEFD